MLWLYRFCFETKMGLSRSWWQHSLFKLYKIKKYFILIFFSKIKIQHYFFNLYIFQDDLRKKKRKMKKLGWLTRLHEVPCLLQVASSCELPGANCGQPLQPQGALLWALWPDPWLGARPILVYRTSSCDFCGSKMAVSFLSYVSFN